MQLGAVQALAHGALAAHAQREHLCRTKRDAALVEAAAKHEAAAAAEEAAERAEVAAQKAIKWAKRGVGGASAEVARDEAVAKAKAAREEAAAAQAEAEAAAQVVAALDVVAAAAAQEAAVADGEGSEGGTAGLDKAPDGEDGAADVVEWSDKKRATLLLCNRVVYHCLGALGVMAVDQRARAVALQVSPTLDFCTHLALAEFPLPPQIETPSPPPEPVVDLEQPEGES